ncbi:MAG: ABC transporter substrate-binding protein [Actinomycetota bacterium]|nr:ABC transporter substrate-binding protein [Actinomycetota bacterium]
MRSRLTLMAAMALVVAACGGGGTGGGEVETPGTEAAPVETTPGTAAGTTAAEGAAGAEGEPVVVGALFDLSGATADVGTPYAEGVRAYVEAINARGGVGERPIELIWQDYQYDVAIAEQLYSQYISQGAVAVQGWGTGDTEALRGRVTSDEVPFMSASYSEELVNPEETPYNFVAAATYSDQMRIALKWISDNFDGHAEVAVFHHDSPFGLSPVADGQAYIEENGLDIGYRAYPMPAGATDYVGELSQAQQQGATHIIVQNVSSPAAQLAGNIASQGLDVQMICLNWCGDEIFIDLAGDAAEGVIGVQPWTPPSVEASGFADPAGFLEEQGRNVEEEGLHFVQGWYTMAVMAEGIATAVEAGEEVTGPAIKAALEEMPAFETGVSSPIEFSAESHAGMEGSPIFQVEGGEWVQLADVTTP